MKNGKRKTKGIGINGKLIGFLLPTIVFVLALLILLIYTSTARIVLTKSEELLQSNSESVVNSVKAWMNEVLTALDTQRDALEYFSLDREAEMDYIRHTVDQYDAFPAGIYVANADGSVEHSSFVPGPEYNLYEKTWYKDGIDSEEIIFGAANFDENSQTYVVGASGRLRDKLGNVRGVVAADIYLDAISAIVKEVKLEQTGGMFLVDKGTGMIIGHKDASILGGIIDQQTDPLYTSCARLLQSGVTGLQTIDGNGDQIYLYLTNVPDSPWAAAAYVPRAEVMASLNTLTVTMIFVALTSILILFVMILLLVRRLVIKPVREIDHVAAQIAAGQLDQSIHYESGDEFGDLAVNFNQTVNRLRDYVNYIDEISQVLEQIGGGNLAYDLTYDYVGEFAKMKHALENISDSLSATLGQIGQAADQVASGSEQVSAGAQSLSQGATEQASSVEELAATINEISGQVSANADNAIQANEKMNALGSKINLSNKQMQDMIEAMEEISSSASQIGLIIKTIEDISFQTNILALNAAVEAARAGEAGKGFAVVADEVRNLASKSAEAAKNTTALIQNSINAVERGTKLADEAAQSLITVVSDADAVVDVVKEISRASKNQAESIAQVTQGMDQISSVVQTNSATAEESAAASEELSAQSQVMKDLVGGFRLKKNISY